LASRPTARRTKEDVHTHEAKILQGPWQVEKTVLEPVAVKTEYLRIKGEGDRSREERGREE
jgi:hypothetical protein